MAEDLALTPGTVTARVDGLVQLGFVTREVDEGDARVRWVELTPVGLRLVDELIPRHLAVEDELLAGISASRRQRMAGDLSALLADLESRYR